MAATRRQAYVYGNTVRQPEVAPGRREESDLQRPKKVSRQVRKNRRKAMHMSAGYVVFLAGAAIAALIVCVFYLQMHSELTERSKNITTLQQTLSEAKEENNTKLNSVLNAVSLDDVKNKAVTELGMVNASPDQIVEYQNQSGDSVKQYESIPKNGVLASSGKTSK